METIKERAQSYTDKVGILGAYLGYIAGANEQHKIDIDKAIQWLTANANRYASYAGMSNKLIDDFRKAMEE